MHHILAALERTWCDPKLQEVYRRLCLATLALTLHIFGTHTAHITGIIVLPSCPSCPLS